MSGNYLLTVNHAPTAAPASDARLRPGEEAELREITARQGYISMDNRFVRGLLAELDAARGAAAPPSAEDLLS